MRNLAIVEVKFPSKVEKAHHQALSSAANFAFSRLHAVLGALGCAHVGEAGDTSFPKSLARQDSETQNVFYSVHRVISC
jgi:hypothetical protein